MTGHLKMAVIVGLLTLAWRAEAASLKVAPARFIVHSVEPGTMYDIYAETGLRLTIFNDDNVAHSWALSVHRPSERGHWETGYDEIPDAAWCWFDQTVVSVEPNSKAYAHLFLQVPGEERFYNQHWVVTLGIDAPPGAGGLALAADIRAQIETKAKEDTAAVPAGLLALKPSLFEFAGAVPGQNADKKVMLFNNDTKKHVYRISSLFAKPGIERSTYLTHEYEAIPDAQWLGHPSETVIEPGQSAQIPLELRVPGDAAHYGKKWEELLLIQPDEGGAGFLRVQVETALKPAGE